MASKPDGSAPPPHAYSAMSKSLLGSCCPKKFGFAGWKPTFSLIPIAPSCCEKIAALVARRWLPTVVSKRNSAFWPPHVQTFVLSAVGVDGPPVQCFARIASAFFALKLYFLNVGAAFGPICQIVLFSGPSLGAIVPNRALTSEPLSMPSAIACRIHRLCSRGADLGPNWKAQCSCVYDGTAL